MSACHCNHPISLSSPHRQQPPPQSRHSSAPSRQRSTTACIQSTINASLYNYSLFYSTPINATPQQLLCSLRAPTHILHKKKRFLIWNQYFKKGAFTQYCECSCACLIASLAASVFSPSMLYRRRARANSAACVKKTPPAPTHTKLTIDD